MLPITPGTRVVSSSSGSRGTRTHNGKAAACFQNRFLIRPDDFRLQAAGAGIEPTSRRSERPVLPLNDPASVFFADTHRPRQNRRQGSGGRNRTCDLVVQSHASHTISDDPGMLSARRVPCGNRTRLSSLEGWCLSRSAKGTCRQGGRRGSRTLKAVKLVPIRAGCHRQLACPSVASRLRRQESNLRRDA